MKRIYLLASVSMMIMTTSCVSKKKYNALQSDYDEIRANYHQTQIEKEDLETKYSAIQEKVSNYYAKINSLQEDNDRKLEIVEGVAAISNKSKEAMRATLQKVDPTKVAEAKTLEDSLNLAISYNLGQKLSQDEGVEEGDIHVDIDETVVMINISDKLLFQSGSASVNRKAYPLLKKIAKVINSEPAMEVMVEGHTDNTKIRKSNFKDNWQLSVERATAIIRVLQDKYDVSGEKLIASGRSSYDPLVPNDSWENRATNRRTRIIILPNLDKFLAMLESQEAM